MLESITRYFVQGTSFIGILSIAYEVFQLLNPVVNG